MLGLQELQELIANEFLGGSMELAGIGFFVFVMLVIFCLTHKNPFMALIIGMGVTMFFSVLGVLPVELTVLLIVVSVLGLAYTSRSIWRD